MQNKIKKENIPHNPNLVFKQIITTNNTNRGVNSIFEVYQLLTNNELYLASPQQTETNIEIILIKTCQKLISLEGHKDFVNIIKYYFNKKNNNEYLISVDKINIAIIWDINNNYSKIYTINGEKSIGIISDFLFCNIKLNNTLDNYIVFSKQSKEYTSIYSLDDKKIKVINKSNEYFTYFMIYWNNRKDNNDYIIELSDGNIYINNINDDTLYDILNTSSFNYSKNNCAFIYTIKDKIFLFVSNLDGKINIWDLENKCFIYNITLNCNRKNNSLLYILKWSNKYMIILDYYERILKIMDFDTFKIITKINLKHLGSIIYAKKFIHPIYGESLLTAGQDNNIILWSI